jgi:large subunit ribosomal protein L20
MRITSAVERKKAHKKVFKFVKGFTHRRKNCYRIAKQARDTARLDAYIGRKLRKRENRSLNIMRINAFCREHGTTYSKFIHQLTAKQLNISRKTLADLCISSPHAAINLLKSTTV